MAAEHANIRVCHACPKRQRPCAGACLCEANGKDITENANAHDCPEQRFPARGIGDVVAKVTTAFGIKPCEKCKETQKRWNEAMPFGSQQAPHVQDVEAQQQHEQPADNGDGARATPEQ